MTKNETDLLSALVAMLGRHDAAVGHTWYRKGEKYENRTARPRADGRAYVFQIAGPEGTGYYPCWCNPQRALIDRIEKEQEKR